MKAQFSGETAQASATIKEISSRGCRVLDRCNGAQARVFEARIQYRTTHGEAVTTSMKFDSPFWSEGDTIDIVYPVANPDVVTFDLDSALRFWTFRQIEALVILFIGIGIGLHQWFSPNSSDSRIAFRSD
ncbi:DUF3592 domain-containing protein [Hoeflea prorocentri]|uniref:DUF3592 domain-containing protein n=1 Tax=Hoeflea prorocentri TaxID=1922333 RepID=A0A9X3UMG3_9HYPH|nr:DUF3592 domain-containing protein [Hoeflea prorocentri]MCY6381889.1 hypothetical protein [Hoeflea prorocentri]MDA5399689.1 hypothetical protein [Hoeflea prorocentri]